MLKRSHPAWGWESISVVNQPYFSLFPARETGCGIDTSIMYQHFSTIASKIVVWSLLQPHHEQEVMDVLIGDCDGLWDC